MQTPRTSPRPRLTLPILLFAAVDVVGMVLISTGIMWFVHRQALFIPGFPTGVVDAGIATVVGLLLMVWSAAQILRELTKQIDRQHPERFR